MKIDRKNPVIDFVVTSCRRGEGVAGDSGLGAGTCDSGLDRPLQGRVGPSEHVLGEGHSKSGRRVRLAAAASEFLEGLWIGKRTDAGRTTFSMAVPYSGDSLLIEACLALLTREVRGNVPWLEDRQCPTGVRLRVIIEATRNDRELNVTKLRGAIQQLTGQIRDCDFCHRPMTLEEYQTHCCDGLGGLNPWQEKLKRAKWKVPAARLKAKGSIV